MALSRTNYIVSARIDSLQVWYNYIISLISPDLSAPDGPHPFATRIAGPDLPYVHTKYFTTRGGDRVFTEYPFAITILRKCTSCTKGEIPISTKSTGNITVYAQAIILHQTGWELLAFSKSFS